MSHVFVYVHVLVMVVKEFIIEYKRSANLHLHNLSCIIIIHSMGAYPNIVHSENNIHTCMEVGIKKNYAPL